MVKTFTAATFDQEVLKSPIPVLVDFTATWCGPCKALAPIMEELAREYAGKVSVGKVDIDENGELAGTLGISSVPTVIAFHQGSPAGIRVGMNPKTEYRALLDGLIAGTR